MYKQYSQLNRYRESKVQVRAVIYARCSHDEQKKNGFTVSDQVNFGHIFAQEQELYVVGEYIDEGISATLEIHKRKALAQLIKDAKAGKFDVVIFKCIDRFFRNTEEYYTAQKQLRKAGVSWISIEEADLDPADPDAAFKINIYLAMAEYEARKTSKRIRFNNAMRIKNKQVVTGDNNFFFPWSVVGEKRNKHLVRNLEKKDMLFDLLEHFETHQAKRKTLSYINVKYGTTFTIRLLTELLQDTLLYGEYKGVPDYVEPWITKERFDHIQDILKRNATYSPQRVNTFLFSGLIKCRCCGRTLIGTSNTNGVLSYRCVKHSIESACENNNQISEKKIEKQLLTNLETYIKNEIVKVESIAEKDKMENDNTEKIEEIKAEMRNLNIMFRKNRITEKEYDKDYAVLEAELSLYEKKDEPEERNLDSLKALLESDFRTMYDALDKEHRKAFWKNLVKEFSIGEDRKIVPESVIFF